MSKADGMFEKLGYEKSFFVMYTFKTCNHQFYITFNSAFKKCLIDEHYFDEKGNPKRKYIDISDTSLEVARAINEKCKELRMDGGIEYGRKIKYDI